MEQFVVSARKYRPQTFKDVVGQQAITNTLLNAIENNHLASALYLPDQEALEKLLVRVFWRARLTNLAMTIRLRILLLMSSNWMLRLTIPLTIFVI